jgi:hypothetical protein
MREVINERVEVITVYNRIKGAMPYRIRWQGRDYKVAKLAYYFRKRIGRVMIHVFHISTDNLDMCLEFDGENLHWMLREVTDGRTN